MLYNLCCIQCSLVCTLQIPWGFQGGGSLLAWHKCLDSKTKRYWTTFGSPPPPPHGGGLGFRDPLPILTSLLVTRNPPKFVGGGGGFKHPAESLKWNFVFLFSSLSASAIVLVYPPYLATSSPNTMMSYMKLSHCNPWVK